MEKIRVIVADDHKIVRIGLQGILKMEEDVEVIGEAEDGVQVLALVKENVTNTIRIATDIQFINKLVNKNTFIAIRAALPEDSGDDLNFSYFKENKTINLPCLITIGLISTGFF